jgi:hypothetical protein
MGSNDRDFPRPVRAFMAAFSYATFFGVFGWLAYNLLHIGAR